MPTVYSTQIVHGHIIQRAHHPTAIRSKLAERGIRLIGDSTLGTVADASKTRG
jgi:hypothetical protein